MELGLSLGDTPTGKTFMAAAKGGGGVGKSSDGRFDLGFCMGLGLSTREMDEEQRHEDDDDDEEEQLRESSGEPPVQLELLPLSPVPRQTPLAHPTILLPQLALPCRLNRDGSNREGGLDVNRVPTAEETEEERAAIAVPTSSPNGGVPFQMDFTTFRIGDGGERLVEGERASSRASDEEDNGLTRKKLRLSKEQSAFLEESFKEHHTLNPKQKLALAKQLNLRPRQVEVWFQNRRARTKLKQTEVDCEYLKRCCEKLTEENRRLQKELQELRALKTAQPFYMHVPATTLTMCPSCERVATTSSAPNSGASNSKSNGNNPSTSPTCEPASASASNQQMPSPGGLPVRPRPYPFGPSRQNQRPQENVAAVSRHQ